MEPRRGSVAPDRASRDAEPDRYQIVTDPAILKSLQEDWNALHARSAERRCSQSFAWCWTTWEVVEAPQGHRLHCLVARNRGRLVLLWPFVIAREHGFGVARPLGTAYGEYSDVLVEDGPEAAARAGEAWRLFRASCRCSVVMLPNVRAGSRLHALLSCSAAGRKTEIGSVLAVGWDGIADWETYLGSLKTGDRQDLRRTRRRLEELGRVTFEPVADEDRCAVLVDWVLRRKIEQLAATNRHAPWLETLAYRRLLTTAASRGRSSERLVVFTLTLGERLLAALVTRVDTRRIETLVTVYDPEYRKYGPGQLLWASCLEWACARRLEFDMRPGVFQYKKEWANRACEVASYEISNSAWAPLYFVGRFARQPRRLVPNSWRKSVKAALSRKRS